MFAKCVVWHSVPVDRQLLAKVVGEIILHVLYCHNYLGTADSSQRRWVDDGLAGVPWTEINIAELARLQNLGQPTKLSLTRL